MKMENSRKDGYNYVHKGFKKIGKGNAKNGRTL